MNIDAVVQVFGSSEGSGYQIAATLVVTAAHVVAGSDTAEYRSVPAVRRGEIGRQTANVVWRHPTEDLALLEIDARQIATSRLGRLHGELPVPVDALGFPDATLGDDRRREAFPVVGDCHPRSGAMRGRLQLRVSSLQPVDAHDWRGLSGAAVFAGDALIGVLTDVPRKLAGALQMRSIEGLLESPELADRLRAAGLDLSVSPIDAETARPFGALGLEATRDAYTAALLGSFRLDAAGLAIDGASHALALANAYAGTRFAHEGDRDVLALSDLASRRRIVLVGEPGSGKSIALKQVLAEVARREQRAPVLLRLADFAATLTTRDPSPADFVRAFAARAHELGASNADERFFRQLLAHGDLAIGLDGFDEAGDKAARERIATAIGALADAAPNVRLYVASRPAELTSTPLPPSTVDGALSFVKLSVQPLDGVRAREFLRVCFDDRDGALWAKLRADEHVVELTETPLLLTLVALLAGRGPMPAGRFETHDAVINTAVETWVKQRGQGERSGARDVLEALALAMMDRDVPAAPILLADAIKALSPLASNPSDVVDWLVRNTGLLMRAELRGAKLAKVTLQFAHLQLQEHLAGCALAKKLAADDKAAWAIVKRSGVRFHWQHAHRAAAAWLARNNGESAIERWARQLVATRGGVIERTEAALRAALVLGEADAAFCPADKLTAKIVSSIARHYLQDERHAALFALVPRTRALEVVRDIALQTEAGCDWLGSQIYEGGHSSMDCRAVATSVRLLCAHRPDDAAAALALAIEYAPRTASMTPWVQLGSVIEHSQGRAAAEAFLRSLAHSDMWRMDATVDDVVHLLDRIDLAGYAALARNLALEGTRFNAIDEATVGFVTWLEAQRDPATLPILDAYYERLGQVIADYGARRVRLSGDFHPLWPKRDSDAIHSLRIAVLNNVDTIYRVMFREPFDPRYAEHYRAASRLFFATEDESSRVRGMATKLLDESVLPFGPQMLFDAIGNYKADLWAGESIVRLLIARGRGVEVSAKLSAIRDADSTTDSHRFVIDSLLRLCSAQP